MRFSIMGEESLDRAVEQAIMGMKKGSHLLKCGRRGKPKFCPFRLSTDEKHLVWYSGEKEKQLRLSSISKIIPGQRTVNFQRHLQLDKESQSFSLIYANSERSLDLICKDKVQADSWFSGLKIAISRSHHSKLCNGSRSRRGGAQSCVNSPAGVIRRKQNLGLAEDNVGFSQVRSVCGSPTLSFSDGLSYCSETHEQNVPETYSPCVRPNDLKRRGSSLGRSEFQNYIPDRVLEKHDDVLKDILIWGEGIGSGVLGGGVGKQADAYFPRVLESAVMLDVESVCLGGKHVGIVTKSGEVFCWGEAKGGRLGHRVDLDSCEPKIVESLTGVQVKSIACGEYRTCAVTQSGELYTWGDNASGARQWWPRRLSGALDGVSVINVACGEWHVALVSMSGRLFTFGDGTFGVLGHGDFLSVPSPKEVDSLNGLAVKSVACGPWHTAAIVEVVAAKHPNNRLSSGKLFTWGDGDKGRLGHGDTGTKTSPTCVAQVVDHDFVQVCCGRNLTVALTDESSVYTMGSAAHGQLGNPRAKDKSVTLVEFESSSSPVAVTQVSSGSYHVVALTSTGRVYTWGKGLNGQLGLGDTEDRNTPTLLESLRDRRVESVACGASITAAISLHRPISAHDQSACKGCKMAFGFTRKKHNCYNCGFLFCRACSSNKARNASLAPNKSKPSRVCDPCFNHLQRPFPPRGSVGEGKSPRQVLSRDEVEAISLLSSAAPETRMRQWGRVEHSWLLDMDFTTRHNAIVPFCNKNSYSSDLQTSPRVLSESCIAMNSEEGMPVSQPDKMLVDKVRRLRVEARVLEKQYEIGNKKLQECQERIEEAWAVAREEAGKCKAAKEIIKALALQFHALSEKRVPKDDGFDSGMAHIAPICTETHTPKPTSNDKPARASPMLVSNTPNTKPKPHEWVEEYEPGIYLTLTNVPTGQTSVKRVRFSRKRFCDEEATRWWKENQGVVYRKYGVENVQ